MDARRRLGLALAMAGLLTLAAASLMALAGLFKPPLRQGLAFSQAVYDRDGRLLRLTLSPDGKYRLWTPLAEISPLLVEAALLQEDRRFRSHHGVDARALLRAAWTTYGSRARRVGGSTVTMQLARLRYGIVSRTPWGKLRQIAKAVALETFYSKDQLLEAYLNLVPYGGNVEGAGAASLIYFGKDAASLNLIDALSLAVVPQNPARRSLAEPSPARQEARDALFDRWAAAHPEDAARAGLLASPWPSRTAAELPFEAPHFVNELLSRQRDERLASTLDLRKQKLLERLISSYVERRGESGVKNAAALLVDAREMEVVAAVGSAGFFNKGISGQVDGLRALRSPGSTLKPFVYGLAMDQGLLHPQTMLKDAPMSFNGFNPENFDNDFIGPVKAGEALIKSRNIPAIAVSAQLKDPDLYGFLKNADVPLPHPPEYYGLGLTLGAAELTAQDLARLYGALGAAGTLRSLRRLRGEPPGREKRVLSPEAAFLVLEMLKENPRPQQSFRASWTRGNLPVYWKTGTSFSFRDAWTAGLFGPYVLVVWIGNFNGEGNPAFVGIDAAAPLFFEIVDAVRAQEPNMKDLPSLWPQRVNVARVKVCAVSGKLPGRHCPHATWTWFIPGVSPIAVCDVHREVLVDKTTGLRACGEGPNAVPKVFEFWPSDLLKIFRQAGVPRRLAPDFDPACGVAAEAPGKAPLITSPLSGVTYNIRSAARGEEIPLTAVTDGDARRLYWFVDDRLVGQTLAGRAFFWQPEAGRFTVRVVDDRGRSDARELTVGYVD